MYFSFSLPRSPPMNPRSFGRDVLFRAPRLRFSPMGQSDVKRSRPSRQSKFPPHPHCFSLTFLFSLGEALWFSPLYPLLSRMITNLLSSFSRWFLRRNALLQTVIDYTDTFCASSEAIRRCFFFFRHPRTTSFKPSSRVSLFSMSSTSYRHRSLYPAASVFEHGGF